MKALLAKEAVTDVVTHEVAPRVDTDARPYSRLGWLLVLLGMGGFLLWAGFAPLDKGVPVTGTVAKETNRKAIQHQTGGIVQDILVKEGQQVKAGQVLVKMNSVQADSQFEVTRSQYITARATEARLLAERDGKNQLVVPKALLALKDDPRVQATLALQDQLRASRQSALASELAAVDESVAGLKIQAAGMADSRERKVEQLALLKEQLVGMRDLAKDGYIARNRLLELERTYSQTSGALSEDAGNIGRAQRQIQEMTLRRAQRVQDYQKEVRTQLSDAQRDAEAMESRLVALRFELSNAEVRSPVDGVVLAMSVFTRGGVVGPGFRMMDVVPLDDALVVEGKIPVNLIDKVHVGLPVEFIFSAFNNSTTPHIPGVVTTVGADSVVEERTGAAYYKVTARVTKEGMQLLARKKLAVQPGMPVELFVKTGERTMMSYLLKPVFDRAKSSMSED